jgi:hypothetical protein
VVRKHGGGELARRLCWISLVMTAATLCALVGIDLHLRNAVSPQGIVSFEVCAYTASCAAIVEAWDPGGQVWAGLSLGLDYLFMLLYAATIFLALRVSAKRLPETLRQATRHVAWLAWGAAAADAFENYALIRMLVAPEAMSYSWPAAVAATVKFALIGVTIAWLVAAWLYPRISGRQAHAG